MLKLKRVEIHGFKSFYDRTEMKFSGSGIAAVVGPNGCGKSNLCDAISWVLGEQSAKSLRGARMEDVIFAGTRDKKPLGMASVTMTLVPDESVFRAAPPPAAPEAEREVSAEGAAPENAAAAENPNVHYVNGHSEHAPIKTDAVKAAERTGEITITRRLYRSGESEYLINGKAARLRDIQDLFLGTGLGPESYAIIEQGRIGQILSNKPQDRRNVIEEAAGITKFKTRKRLAEAKLESAKQNLSRVFDILEEVTRQANSLKRQAAKTKRFSELKAEATSYLKQVLAAKFQLSERETAKIAIELNLISSEVQKAQAEIAERETSQAALLEASYANEQELTAARKQLADLQLESERVRGKLEYQARQIVQIQQRLTTGEQESANLERQQQERKAEFEQYSVELEALERECAAARGELDEKTKEREALHARLAEQERGLETTRQLVVRLLGESAGLKNRITHLEAQLATSDRDSARARSEEQQANADLARVQQQRAEISERLAARQTDLISVGDQRTAVEQELQARRSALGESRQNLDRVRSELSRIKARRDSIGDVIQHRSYTTETVKRLFTAVENGKAGDLRVAGVLADFVEVEPQLEKATEEFLHDELEYVVVSDWQDAERGIEIMRNDLNGRATFLVENAATASEHESLPAPPAGDGQVSKLSDALRFTNGLAKLPLSLLPRIANCYVTKDRETARRLAAEFPHLWFLTPEGVNYQGSAVSGGKKTGAGPLALKRELRELGKLEQAKENELEAAQSLTTALEREIAKLGEQAEHLRAKQQAQEKDVLALDHQSRNLAEELQRIQSRLSRARLELDRVSRDRVKLETELERDRGALAQIDERRSEQEQALEGGRQSLAGFQAEVAQAAEEHSSIRAQLASLDERRRSVAAHGSRVEAQLRDLTTRRAQLARDMERFVADREHLQASNTELNTRTVELKAAIAAAEADVTRLAAQETELRAALASAKEELKRLRMAAHAAHEKRSELQVALARAEADLQHLEETCRKELDTSLAELVKSVGVEAETADVGSAEAKYLELLRKIEALGPVNPQALEEFEEAQQRQEFLNTQRQDLLDSIRDTEKAIREIDQESKKRFAHAFQAINANFREMFKTLFGGGIGEMRLTDEENLGESGIDIVASPPGKKLQSVLLLSGGEKSLTAMALLMAIFQYTPSPFCILDEVDAPLDDANVERLTKLLREMAAQTQFIVITHAKRTMEAAQALYGVTMQEPGVSKVVSVRFKQEGAAVRDAQAAEPKEILHAIA